MLPHLPHRVDSSVETTPGELRALERRLLSRKHMFSGVVALRLGNRSLALVELRRARALDPQNREAERILTRLADATR